jgi:hypothetical protein
MPGQAGPPRAAAPASPPRAAAPAARPIAPGAPAAGRPAAPAAPPAAPPARPVAPRTPAAPPPPPPPPVDDFVVDEDPPVEPAHYAAEEIHLPPPGGDGMVAPEEQHAADHIPLDAQAAHDAEVAAEADAVAHVIEDDDTLNLPPPPPESLAHPKAPKPRGPRQLKSRTVEFKQTMIPPLLVSGLLLGGIAGYSLMLGEESPLATQSWFPITLAVIGGVLLIFAVITMLQVAAQLKREREEREALEQQE